MGCWDTKGFMGIVFGVIRGRWLVIPNEGTVFEAHKLPSVYNLLYNVMDQYRILHPIGSGTFGQVFLAEDLLHHQPVALKILTQPINSFQQCLKLRQVRALRRFKHPSLMTMRNMLYQNQQLVIVCEYAKSNLYDEFVGGRRRATLEEIREISRGLLQGVKYLHEHGCMHRDIKPENILVFPNGKVKFCDFGLAKQTREFPHTHYVSTRWYRAPQLLINTKKYGPQVDIFALGCVIAQLFNQQALFPGTSSQDQLCKILQVCGKPTNWPEFDKLTQSMNFSQGSGSGNWNSVIPRASEEALDLIKRMLEPNPKQRISARKALKHRFFNMFNFLGEYELGGNTRTLPMFMANREKKTNPPKSIRFLSEENKPLLKTQAWNTERSSDKLENTSPLRQSTRLILKTLYARKKGSSLSPIAARSLNFRRHAQENALEGGMNRGGSPYGRVLKARNCQVEK